jgi:RNA polymerase sigma-70 factor (ECF subfamily)
MNLNARPLAAEDPAIGAEETPDCAASSPGAISIETLYREESPRLVRSLARRLSSRDEARDLVHEIFCRIAKLGADDALRLERPQAYLSRMATNLLRDRAKASARRMQDRHVEADENVLPALDPHRILESRDMLRRLEAAVLKMRPKTRDIFLAHRVDGLSYAEIAETTGLSVKGVEKQMSKAIAHLDRTLDRG